MGFLFGIFSIGFAVFMIWITVKNLREGVFKFGRRTLRGQYRGPFATAAALLQIGLMLVMVVGGLMVFSNNEQGPIVIIGVWIYLLASDLIFYPLQSLNDTFNRQLSRLPWVGRVPPSVQAEIDRMFRARLERALEQNEVLDLPGNFAQKNKRVWEEYKDKFSVHTVEGHHYLRLIPNDDKSLSEKMDAID